jgi:hypothetical protein
MTAPAKTEMEATSARVSPALVTFRKNPGHDLWAACEGGDWEAASRVNLELAAEFPFIEQLRVVSLLWIGKAWDNDASKRAGAAWANSLRREREKLTGLTKRLESANPIEGAKAKLAGLAARLEVAKPKIEERVVPAEPSKAKRERPKLTLALPGVAGEVQEHYLRTAMQPSEILSIPTALSVVGTLVCDRVIGPSGPEGAALNQLNTAVAPTGGGKNHCLYIVEQCLEKIGKGAYLGPDRFKSGPGLLKWVTKQRVSLCLQDEFGAMLLKLAHPRSNPCEAEISEHIRKLMSVLPGQSYRTPEGAHDDMEKIKDPRLNIFGLGVPSEFYESCRNRDIRNGFLNRMMLYEETKLIRFRSDYHVGDFPFSLHTELDKLTAIKKQRLGWTRDAEEIFEAAKDRLQATTDENERQLWARTPEKIVKIGSILTTCLFAPDIGRAEMELADLLVRHSDEMFMRGINEANKYRLLEHAELRREVVALIEDAWHTGAPALTKAEITKRYKHNTKHKHALKDVFDDIEQSGTAKIEKFSTSGRLRKGFVPCENNEEEE